MEKSTAQKIAVKIYEASKELDWPTNESWQVYVPEKSEHGHYATNIAMIMAKEINQDPIKLAQDLSCLLNKDFRTEVARPGFINFFLEPNFLCQEWQWMSQRLDEVVLSDHPRKVQIEFVSANPTGPLTLGNGRGGFFGDVLGNVMRRAGHDVTKEYYVNDAGYQVQRLGESILGYPESSYQGDYINELRQQIKADNPVEAGRLAANHILDTMIKPDLNKIGIIFDVWFSEQDLYREKAVDQTLIELEKRKLTEEKEGAIWLKTTLFGDEKDRVLVKATGEMTYLMADLAYHQNKFKRGFDLMINIWGADHQGHIQPLIDGLKALGYESGKLEVLIAQWVKIIKNGQELTISKRRGEYVTIMELVEEVGLDATRYFFLDRSLNSHLNFDLDLAIKKSAENPVYYIQYAHARIQSILSKADFQENKITWPNGFVFNHPSELNLIAKILQYPEIISTIDQNYEVHKLPQYAYNLASAFHQFYRDCPVVGASDQLQQARLLLLASVKKLLKEVLSLMGINAPDQM
jgi:arginyl-tRNA synthetase